MTDFSSQTILIVGLAREGQAAAQWLAARGAHIIASDLRPPAEDVREKMEAAGVRLMIGPQTPDLLRHANVVVVSPGVPQEIPLLQGARARNIPITTEPRLFAQGNPAPLVGVTGSSGKTTTATLVARMLEASGFQTWLGGNIGSPLLPQIANIRAQDRVVMELSSFQLIYWQSTAPWPQAPAPWNSGDAISPQIAAILNLTPNHLDRHPSMAHYIAAKANILAAQKPGDAAILNRDDPLLAAWIRSGQVEIAAGPGQKARSFPLAGRLITFGFDKPQQGDGAWLSKGRIYLRHHGQTRLITTTANVQLRGQHNLANVLAAVAIASAAGASRTGLRDAIRSFRGVPHRLEEVLRTPDNIVWINDSIATAPERAIAALRSYQRPIILLAGGRDKDLPWQDWAQEAQKRARIIIAFGEAAPIIQRALQKHPAQGQRPPLHQVKDLPQAVQLAHQLARTNDVVLLSPGGTSFDAYVDFAARGQHFRQLVKSIATA